MNILVTGSKGFVGRNLMAGLQEMQRGLRKNPLPPFSISTYDTDTDPNRLAELCSEADFVFHLAGVNRSEHEADFMAVNYGLTCRLLAALQAQGNRCPVMLASSIQAQQGTAYGRSKLAGEEAVFGHAAMTGARALVYRFPNLFGKWSKPNYNSVVATFCHHLARDIPIQVQQPDRILELAYIDDVVDELLRGLTGEECRQGQFCQLPVTYRIRLEGLARQLEGFRHCREENTVPDLQDDFSRKLYATYLSYLPEDGFSYPLTMHRDSRGSFTELLRTPERGQMSVNILGPHVTKGNHYHHTKHEKFMVVSGQGMIRLRALGSCRVLEYRVCGACMEAVEIPPGYTHNIENLGDEDMAVLMWCSECFDPSRPDTYPMEVEPCPG